MSHHPTKSPSPPPHGQHQQQQQQQASPTAATLLSTLSDPPTPYIDAIAMDLFSMELVQTLYHSASISISRQKEFESDMVESGLLPPPSVPGKQSSSVKGPAGSGSSSSLNLHKDLSSIGGGEKDELEEGVRVRLEGIGFHVGTCFSERLCRDKPLIHDTLDAVKFICKDVWIAFWDKQVDNLRTNHRGVYVLTDNQFKPILRISSWESRSEAIRRSKIYTAISAGLIKGVLARLGYANCNVHSEVTSLPACTFQVKIPSK